MVWSVINGIGCYYTGWGVSERDGMLVNGKAVVNRLACYFPGWGVSKQDGVLLFGMGC